MIDLITALDYSFENVHSSYDYRSTRIQDVREDIAYMIIPISSDTIEVPSLALQTFETNLQLRKYNNYPEELAITLTCQGARTNYKSLEAVVRDVFPTRFNSYHLIRIPEQKDTTKKYYITNGAIFDEDFKPIVMVTWQIQKVYYDNTAFKLRFLRPILRVSPEIVINRSNSIERFIVNKLMPNVLSIYRIEVPSITGNDLLEAYTSQSFKAKVVIDKMPFPIKKVDIPSISTTNEELLDVALSNIDELVQ